MNPSTEVEVKKGFQSYRHLSIVQNGSVQEKSSEF
jgi:hypothetical protein